MLGNPARGPDAEITFHAQSTYVLSVAGTPGAFIFIADQWHPENAIDGRYVWLPIHLNSGEFTIAWISRWNLSIFDKQNN